VKVGLIIERFPSPPRGPSAVSPSKGQRSQGAVVSASTFRPDFHQQFGAHRGARTHDQHGVDLDTRLCSGGGDLAAASIQR
jgi:hypothetical protein